MCRFASYTRLFCHRTFSYAWFALPSMHDSKRSLITIRRTFHVPSRLYTFYMIVVCNEVTIKHHHSYVGFRKHVLLFVNATSSPKNWFAIGLLH
mgnify:FL=1